MFTTNKRPENTPEKAKRKVKYPWLRRAAAEMGYDFTYLYRVLEGYPGFKGRPGLEAEYWAVSRRIESERGAKRKQVQAS